jgi:hypothetical protein
MLSARPHSGVIMLTGELRATHPLWYVTRDQLRRVYRQCRPPEELAAMARKARFRSQYYNPGANDVWHVDTHCKLAFAGMYIHAGVDGHSKLTTYACVSPFNSAQWALRAFQTGCSHFDTPKKVRTDHGTENGKIAKYLAEHGGIHLQGPSTSNVPIERRWKDMTASSVLRSELHMMHDAGVLSFRTSMSFGCRCASWLVYGYFFQELLNTDLHRWNFHPCSTLSKNMSPFAAWSDSMYMQKYSTRYLTCDHPAADKMADLRVFSVDKLHGIFLSEDAAAHSKVTRLHLSSLAVKAVEEILTSVRAACCNTALLPQLRRAFRQVQGIIATAAVSAICDVPSMASVPLQA